MSDTLGSSFVDVDTSTSLESIITRCMGWPVGLCGKAALYNRISTAAYALPFAVEGKVHNYEQVRATGQGGQGRLVVTCVQRSETSANDRSFDLLSFDQSQSHPSSPSYPFMKNDKGLLASCWGVGARSSPTYICT